MHLNLESSVDESHHATGRFLSVILSVLYVFLFISFILLLTYVTVVIVNCCRTVYYGECNLSVLTLKLSRTVVLHVVVILCICLLL